MDTKPNALIAWVALLALGSGAYAQATQPYIGVLLDPAPLPRLLTKHLGLGPNQGVRIRNVSVGSPADEIGLERDDIIIGFQGEDVLSVDAFISGVQAAGVGATVRLEVVHLGRRKTLECELQPVDRDPQWRYPPEPSLYGRYFESLPVPRPDLDRWPERRDRVIERLQRQMEQMQQRMEELERRYRRRQDEPSDPPGQTDSGNESAERVIVADYGGRQAV